MRIDKLLWYLRLAKSRTVAQAMAEAGHIRVDGKRVERASQKVAAGSIVVLPLPQGVKAIEILSLPTRRGPAPEAQSCYRVLDGTEQLPLAAAETNHAAKGDLQP